MGKGYEIIDISGDIGLRVYGRSLEELFINASKALYNLMTNLEQFIGKETIDVELISDSSEGLFVKWLNELIFRFDTYGFVGRIINIEHIDGKNLRASLIGEGFDPSRHERGLLVKAATYHNVLFKEKDGFWIAEVVLDI